MYTRKGKISVNAVGKVFEKSFCHSNVVTSKYHFSIHIHDMNLKFYQ
jgi:hypothetical protein